MLGPQDVKSEYAVSRSGRLLARRPADAMEQPHFIRILSTAGRESPRPAPAATMPARQPGLRSAICKRGNMRWRNQLQSQVVDCVKETSCFICRLNILPTI